MRFEKPTEKPAFRTWGAKDARPLDAAAVLFRVRRPGDEMLPRDGFDNGWGGRFARGLEIIEVRGDYWSLVKDERDCAALARQINVALDSIAPAPEAPG